MIKWAMENNKPMEYINVLFQERREEIIKDERSRFNRAKAIFQKSLPDFRRNVHVNFENSSSDYWFLDLDEMIKVVKDPLADNGFSYDWDHEQKNSEVIVTCILSHVDGHTKSTSLRYPEEANGIQGLGSTLSYLRRYTFLSILGMSSGAKEDDGKRAKPTGKDIPAATDREYADTIAAIKSGKLNLEDAEKNRRYSEIQRSVLQGVQNDRDFNQSKPIR